MYNLLIALAVSVLSFAGVLLADLPWYAGLPPALLLFPLVLYVLARRTGQQLQAALAPVQALMAELPQARSQADAHAKLDQVRQRFAEVRDVFGPWQLLLSGQLEAQIGMLDYMQGRFDAALPRLSKAWRDPMATLYEGCVHARRGRLDQAWAAFERASGYSNKEATVYLIWGLVAAKKGDTARAVTVFAKGLEALPGHPEIKKLHGAVANKHKVDPTQLGELWFRFFPEDAAQAMMVRGRRDKGPMDGHVAPGAELPRARGGRGLGPRR